jgi:5-methylcytosine-specific restriction endonuclease McrA
MKSCGRWSADERPKSANTADFRRQLRDSFAIHIEHIIARQHGGLTEPENLALACSYCNFHKGPNIATFDPETGQIVPLFHPRRDNWAEHFGWHATTLVGRTPIGRATVQLLAMNGWQRVEVRNNLRSLGEPFAG